MSRNGADGKGLRIAGGTRNPGGPVARGVADPGATAAAGDSGAALVERSGTVPVTSAFFSLKEAGERVDANSPIAPP